MGEIKNAYIVPHPPIIIPEVGKGQEYKAKDTINAFHEVGRKIRDIAPDVIIITTPHGVWYSDYIHIMPGKTLKGSFKDFGAPNIRMEFNADTELSEAIAEKARECGIDAGGLGAQGNSLDHGSLVPLYFISKYYSDFSIIRISIADMPLEQLYIFGDCIRKAIESTDKNAVFIASGDLSHKLLEEGPYGFAEEGPKFDKFIKDTISGADFKGLLEVDEKFCRLAGECGLRSFAIMAGALNGYDVKSNVLSYEGPYGVGYMVAELTTDGQNLSRDLISFYECRYKNEIEATRKAEDPYVSLARQTLEHYVKKGKRIEIPDYLPDEMLKNRAGVFVSIKKRGKLRGCIGTISPVTDSIAEEIIQNAISAGTRDPRFDPVKDFELNELIYSVDVLKEPEPIKSISELDVKRYGVIVSSGYRRGLLLPNLEGVDNPLQQVKIALSKAGIGEDEDFSMERFEVIRHR